MYALTSELQSSEPLIFPVTTFFIAYRMLLVLLSASPFCPPEGLLFCTCQPSHSYTHGPIRERSIYRGCTHMPHSLGNHYALDDEYLRMKQLLKSLDLSGSSILVYFIRDAFLLCKACCCPHFYINPDPWCPDDTPHSGGDVLWNDETKFLYRDSEGQCIQERPPRLAFPTGRHRWCHTP